MPSTLPGPDFVEAVNRNGAKQIVPAAWLRPDSPFAAQFRLPPSAVAREARRRPAPRPGRRSTTTKTPPSGDDQKE